MGKISASDCRTKKLTGGGSREEITTVMIYNLGMTIGLSVSDIDNMTVGEVVDLAYYKINQNEERREKQEDNRRLATQADYDNF